MSPEEKPAQDKVTDFVRKQSKLGSTPIFRVLNFELGARPNLGVAIPGTLLFLGGLAYFGVDRAINGKREAQPKYDDDEEDDD